MRLEGQMGVKADNGSSIRATQDWQDIHIGE